VETGCGVWGVGCSENMMESLHSDGALINRNYN
jgi:hypothetical protein